MSTNDDLSSLRSPWHQKDLCTMSMQQSMFAVRPSIQFKPYWYSPCLSNGAHWQLPNIEFPASGTAYNPPSQSAAGTNCWKGKRCHMPRTRGLPPFPAGSQEQIVCTCEVEDIFKNKFQANYIHRHRCCLAEVALSIIRKLFSADTICFQDLSHN